MAAPSHLQAGSGATDAGGVWSYSSGLTGLVAGDVFVLQILQDGATADAVAITSVGDGWQALDGTGSSLTFIGTFAVGDTTAAYQHLWIGRYAGAGNINISGTNSTSEDLYIRGYVFRNVSTGTTLATVIENSTAGSTANGVGTSATAADTAVTTLGPDRLALNFVAVNDDNAISEFTGESGGDWTLAVSPYAEASGTDGAIALQIAYAYTLEYLVASASETIWGVSGQTQVAQSFVAPSTGSTWRVASVFRALGSPVDDVVFEIHADSSGAPSGTALGSGTVDVTSTTIRVYSASISAALTASSTYWLVMKRSGSLDETNRYATRLSQNAYAGGSGATYNGSSWTTGLTDHTFGVIAAGDGAGTINGGTGSIVDSDAWGVVGFALIGTTVSAAAYQPRHGFVNFQDPGVF